MNIEKMVPLAPYTTFGIGGKAEYFAKIETVTDLKNAIDWSVKHKKKVTILGGGSNVLVSDEGILGLVLKISTSGIDIDQEKSGVRMRVSAGEEWDSFVARVTESGWWGLENLSGIPGTVGAAPIQNINAYGMTVSDVIERVEVLDLTDGRHKIFSHRECAFGYRDSMFKNEGGNRYVVTHVSFFFPDSLRSNTQYKSASQSIETYLRERDMSDPTPLQVREGVLAVRKQIGMLAGMYQSAGSFFKNVIVTSEKFAEIQHIVERQFKTESERLYPWYWELGNSDIKISSAFLMECTTYNKTKFSHKLYNGTVSISPLHSLSIINKHNAHASDIKEFATVVQTEVKKKFNVMLEPEICFL